MTNTNKNIVIVAGGSGGHVFPALSLYNHFLKKKLNPLMISDKRGIRFLGNLPNLQIKTISSSSIFGKNIFSLFFSSLLILKSFFHSIILLLLKKPKIVIGMGGYTSFPVCLAAKVLAVPVIIYENNLIMGKTNKFLQLFAQKIFVAYPETTGINKKNLKKIIITGNIIREEVLNYKNFNILNFEKEIKIIILGGSQAAKIFGEKLPNIFVKLKKSGVNIRIIQQCLKEQEGKIKELYSKNLIDFELFTFSEKITSQFKKADIAITRSGASVSAELLNCKIPFISIPLPTSADNHQYMNAKFFKDKGLCLMILQNEMEEELFKLIKLIAKDKSIIVQIKKKLEKHSDRKVFEIIDEALKKSI
tara:strand:+ start:2250 stop:3335 length:1086 start_codon:yes stop_codon:yes gene_type:complete